jgi:hypothetical protein
MYPEFIMDVHKIVVDGTCDLFICAAKDALGWDRKDVRAVWKRFCRFAVLLSFRLQARALKTVGTGSISFRGALRAGSHSGSSASAAPRRACRGGASASSGAASAVAGAGDGDGADASGESDGAFSESSGVDEYLEMNRSVLYVDELDENEDDSGDGLFEEDTGAEYVDADDIESDEGATGAEGGGGLVQMIAGGAQCVVSAARSMFTGR